MTRFQPSLRKRVNYAYSIGIALLLMIALITYLNLIKIGKKITFNFIISELFDTTLEMRRYEKNYFLYGHKEEDYLANLKFTEKAEDIIKNNKKAIEKVAIKLDVYALEADIQEYKSLMNKYFKHNKALDPLASSTLKDKIREKGREIHDKANAISSAERRYILSLIKSSQMVVIGSSVVFIIISFFTAKYLYSTVIKPLRHLEESMQKIAKEGFLFVPVLSQDKELISLSKALNTMLAELELRQMRFIAQSQKLVSLGTMVSGVAHQLNNPLSNIFVSCQILIEEIEESNVTTIKEKLQEIEEQVERATAMVHSLLQFSREKGFKSELLSLKELMDDTLRLIHIDIPTGIEITVNIPEACYIIGDKQRIQQAFLNIIKNGIDAIPDEGKVFISAEEHKDTKTVEIKIQDTGIGIEPENINRIFDPFFTTKSDEKGSGLGLFVSREIIEEHQGLIEVESIVGQGTIFTIKLPLKEI